MNMQSLYNVTVPVFQKSLANLMSIIDVAAAYAAEKGIAESELLGTRLAPDMFPLVKQIQMTTDNAKGAAARLAGVDVPVFDDTETSFAELKARVARVSDFLKTLTPEQFADADTRKIELKYVPGKHLLGDEYALQYALPNFFFHLTTAYGILRMKGVALGKANFLGYQNWRDN